MTTQSNNHFTQADDTSDLEALGAALAARGYKTAVQTPEGSLPCLFVTNPRAPALSERVLVQAGKFWWPWAEPITFCDEVSNAAAIVATVLRTVDERQ